MNHYSGDQIHQNWGLLKIGGRWTDPDSEYDLYRAIQLHDHGINLYTPPPRPLTRSPELVQTDTGPRIMTPEEEDEFYKGYVDEVTDDVDGEDDPRQYRIAPATFARWAAGCALGERYHEEPFPSVVSRSLYFHFNCTLTNTSPSQRYPLQNHKSKIKSMQRPKLSPNSTWNLEAVYLVSTSCLQNLES